MISPTATGLPVIVPLFDLADRGYEPVAVEARMTQLVAERVEFERRAVELEAEIGALLSRPPVSRPGEPPQLIAARRIGHMLSAAHDDARRVIAAAEVEAWRMRGHAQGMVDAALGGVSALTDAARADAQQAARRLVGAALEQAEAISAEADRRAGAVLAGAPDVVAAAKQAATVRATADTKQLGEDLEQFERDLVAHEGAVAHARATSTKDAAALRMAAKRLTRDAEREAARLLDEARGLAGELLAEAAGRAEQLAVDAEAALAELLNCTEELNAELRRAAGGRQSEPRTPAPSAAHEQTDRAATPRTVVPLRAPAKPSAPTDSGQPQPRAPRRKPARAPERTVSPATPPAAATGRGRADSLAVSAAALVLPTSSVVIRI